MKKNTFLIISFFIFSSTFLFSQPVDKNYIGGEIYFKIKKSVFFKFDTLQRNVDIKTKLPFLIPFLSKYNINNVESSFYFSKSDTLKRIFRLYFKNVKMTEFLINDLKLLNDVEYVEKIPLCKINYIPNDIGINDYWGQYGLYKINAGNAWNVTRGDKSVLVAIVDNAEDINHPDIKDNVSVSWDVSDEDNNPEPPRSDNGWEHGTHTSGIACARTNNSIGISSIGFNCGLMAIKATRNNSSSGNFIDHGYEGIDWAVEHGAKVISCSWGDYVTQTEQNVINYAYDNDVLVVASAGNNNNSTKTYPAAYDHVISVAATDTNDAKASFSSYGKWVSVSAPGVHIFSTLPNNKYGYLDGTSMAAPLVAGLCGLVRSVNPSLSVDQVISIIKSTADNVDTKNPNYKGLLGTGRINAYKAVESALPCYPALDLHSGNYSVPKTESSSSITSANVISSGAAVIFDATTKVDLVPGFHAYSGSSFDAYIDGCGGNKLYESYINDQNQNDNLRLITKQIVTSNNDYIIVYPNPTSSLIHLDFNTSKNEVNVSLQVYNMEMQKLKEINLGNLFAGKHNVIMNLNGLASGIYFIIIPLQSENLKAKITIIK